VSFDISLKIINVLFSVLSLSCVLRFGCLPYGPG
jgi:hypothetical protein